MNTDVTVLKGQQVRQSMLGWTASPFPTAAWLSTVGTARMICFQTYFSNLGWRRRCRRSLTTDFLSKAFSQCFPEEEEEEEKIAM